jgi:uncharacterized membrane protein
MLSVTGDQPMTTVAGLEANTLADGFFHVATWVFVATASYLSVRAWQRRELAPPWRAHFGLLLAGWGTFNVVEGLIDHQLLGIHHVRDDLDGPLGWDLGFLGLGVLLILGGLALARSGARAVPRAARGLHPPRPRLVLLARAERPRIRGRSDDRRAASSRPTR